MCHCRVSKSNCNIVTGVIYGIVSLVHLNNGFLQSYSGSIFVPDVSHLSIVSGWTKQECWCPLGTDCCRIKWMGQLQTSGMILCSISRANICMLQHASCRPRCYLGRNHSQNTKIWYFVKWVGLPRQRSELQTLISVWTSNLSKAHEWDARQP